MCTGHQNLRSSSRRQSSMFSQRVLLRTRCLTVTVIKRYMRDKRTLTRRKATKSGTFDPKTYDWRPSPVLQSSVDETQVSELSDILAHSASETRSSGGNCWKAKCWWVQLFMLYFDCSGKSSLFNRLIGHSKSLVTPTAGTTRQVRRLLCFSRQ